MLSEVKFRCGHIGMMDLTGQAEERAKKLAWYAGHTICPDCRLNAAIGRRNLEQKDSTIPSALWAVHLRE